jgi:ribosomal protein S18 acetylase RimI-like enzyme
MPPPNPTQQVQIDVAPPRLRRQALALALVCEGQPPSQLIIDRAYAQAETDDDEWQGLLIARIAPPAATPANSSETPASTDASALVGAMIVRHLAGRVTSVGAPQIVPTAPPDTARRLVEQAAAAAIAHKSTIAQTLVEPNDRRAIAAFAAAGFHRVAELEYLVWDCGSGGEPLGDAEPQIRWTPYSPALHRRFASLVERTYVESRDCPQLDGLRDIDDILSGYRATGEFSPERWLIASRDGRDVGCLLLADHPADDQWELVYLGVVPESRGHSLGMALTRHAQSATESASRARLVLAVDAANEPAIAVYAKAGFQTCARRVIYLRRFDKPREM